MNGMRKRTLTVVTSVDALTPPMLPDDKAAPSMLREASTLSEREAGSWDLADTAFGFLKQGMKGWAPLNSPGFVLLSPRNVGTHNSIADCSPAICENDQNPNQALFLLSRETSGVEHAGGPPQLEWNPSGLDTLLFMSREGSGIGIELGPSAEPSGMGMLGPQEDQRESHLNDIFHELQTPPAPPNPDTEQETNMETDQAEQPAVPVPKPSRICDETFNPRPARTLSGRLTQPAQPRVLPFHTPSRSKRKPSKKRQQMLAQQQVASGITKGRGKKQRVAHTRGAHVKDRPEMQEKAREGQKNWGTKVHNLRIECQARAEWKENPAYKQQIAMCLRSHIKSQHECVLRQLQLSLIDEEITACKFSSSEDDSFLGWTGFQVVESTHGEFRRKIESLFASPPKENTLNNSFRRAGLVPKENWTEAWIGKQPFKYDGGKRATYSGDQK